MSLATREADELRSAPRPAARAGLADLAAVRRPPDGAARPARGGAAEHAPGARPGRGGPLGLVRRDLRPAGSAASRRSSARSTAPTRCHRPPGARLPHRRSRASSPDGRPYSALNPDTYYWAHATFVEHMVIAADTFIRPLGRGREGPAHRRVGHLVRAVRRQRPRHPDAPGPSSRPTGTTRSSTAWSGTAPRRTASGTPPRAGRARRGCRARVVAGPAPGRTRSARSLTIGGMPAARPGDPRPALGRRPRAPLPPVRPAGARARSGVRRLPPRMRLHPIAARAFAREAGR